MKARYNAKGERIVETLQEKQHAELAAAEYRALCVDDKWKKSEPAAMQMAVEYADEWVQFYFTKPEGLND